MNLPVREYPSVDRPVVSVSTVYRGASNEVIESRVTEVIEGAIAGIEGIRQINSQSQNDRSSVSIEFEVSRNPEGRDLRRARCGVARRSAACPTEPDTPVIRKVDANAQAIMWIGVTSNSLDALELSDFLKRVYVDRLSTVPGVANVSSRRRAAICHADLDRPAGTGGPRLDGSGSRDCDQAAERGTARRTHRVVASASSPSRRIRASPRRKNSSRSSSPTRTTIWSD